MEHLPELGLNRYEESVYHTLITEGPLTAKELSNFTGIPYGKIYEVVDALAIKGYITLFPSKPLRCQATEPRMVMQHVLEGMEQKMRAIEEHMQNTLEPLYLNAHQGERGKISFQIVQGRTNVFRTLAQTAMRANESIRILTTENGLKRMLALKDELHAAHTRGVKTYIAAPLTEGNAEDRASLSFCQFNHINQPASSFFSFDGHTALIVECLPDDENYKSGRDNGVLSQSPSFTRFMDTLFCSQIKSPHTPK